MSRRLKTKVAIVTGAVTWIGEAIALRRTLARCQGLGETPTLNPAEKRSLTGCKL